MPDIAELKNLLKRVRAAEGPDRELDRAVMTLEPYWPAGLKPVDVIKHLDDASVPGLTSSIDAAVSLVERCLPGWNVYVFSDVDSYFAHIEEFRFPEGWVRTSGFEGEGVDRDCWALALIDALIQALIVKAETTDRALSDLAAADGELLGEGSG